MSRVVPLILFVLSLAACSASQPERAYVGLADNPSASPGAILSPPITAASANASTAVLALPDEAGSPGLATEKTYVNGWRQSISLDGKKVAGDWNDLSIAIQTDAPGARKNANIPVGRPTQESVRHEILARFPGTPMRIVGRPMNNSLGPFGLAVGANSGGIRCAFAWQWVDDLHLAHVGGEGGKSLFSGGTPAAIRMRLCRSGVTADQLASWFERLEMKDAASVERAIQAVKQDAGGKIIESTKAARADGTVVADASSLEAIVVPTRVAAPAKREPARRQVARRRSAPRTEQPEPETVTAPAPSAPTSYGRQYLAPVGAAQSTAGYAVAAPVSRGAGFGQARLDPGLPAQAYRGPPAGYEGVR